MPLMLASLLACNNASSTTKITFSSDSKNCRLIYNGIDCPIGHSISIPAEVDVTLTIESNQDYLPIFESNVHIDDAQSYSFNLSKKEITVKVTKNKKCVIKANAETPRENLEAYSWPEISQLSKMELANKYFEVGEEKTVKVNNLDHKVRIIEFSHDDLADGTGRAGITFEFANVITDSNGAVLLYWNINEPKVNAPKNYNFPGSTLNDFLNKNDDCVFNKLPKPLHDAIREVNKKVGMGSEYSTNESYQTKLFPLAHDEIFDHVNGTPNDEGTKYLYFQNGGSTIKTPVDKRAEDYWLRSPYTGYTYRAWCINYFGNPGNNDINVEKYMHAVAPAFCI